MENMIQIKGTGLFINLNDPHVKNVYDRYGSMYEISPRIGVHVDLRELGDDQSVCAGDLKTYHFLLTKK